MGHEIVVLSCTEVHVSAIRCKFKNPIIWTYFLNDLSEVCSNDTPYAEKYRTMMLCFCNAAMRFCCIYCSLCMLYHSICLVLAIIEDFRIDAKIELIACVMKPSLQ
jgi:hypothetical protein